MGAELRPFWAAYGATHEGVRRSAIEGVVKAVREFRRANRYPDDHVVRVDLPPWLFNILSEDERLVMANEFHLHVVPRQPLPLTTEIYDRIAPQEDGHGAE